MSQKIINELTDRVSALTADVSRLSALVHYNSEAVNAAEQAGREVVQTAEGLLVANKRLKAEVEALSARLETMIWTHDDSVGWKEAFEQVEEIKIEARNNLS